MFDVKVLALGVASTAAALMVVGYSHMQKGEKRQGNTVLNAMEEINKTFIKEKNEWEETKDKLIERVLSQEETIKDMEEERKTRDLNILKMEARLEEMEARLEEMEAEEKGNCLVTAALKEEMGEERNKWEEERNQLIREKEALSQKCLSAEQNIEHMKNEKRTAEDRFLSAVQRMEVMRNELKTTENRAFRRELLYSSLQRAAEQRIEIMKNEMKTKACGALKMEEEIKGMEEGRQRREERKKREESFQLISADQRNEDVNTMKVLQMEEKVEEKMICPLVQLVNKWTTQFCELTLDPNTANIKLSLSEDNRTVTPVIANQSYPHHPDRFDMRKQVLCRQGLTGRCYWEVEWRGRVSIAVTYRGINRKGKGVDSLFGSDNKSWSLLCEDGLRGSMYAVRHNGESTKLPFSPSDSNRVGAYLDCSAGILSFYRVSSGTRTHLYRWKVSTFIEPLYPGFGLRVDSSLSLLEKGKGGPCVLEEHTLLLK